MSGQPFDPEQFKAQQRQSWNNVAASWQAWWKTFEDGAQRVSDRIVELAEIKPGDRVLDIATGIGEPAITAARRVRPGGSVLATDISPQMLATASARAKSLGLESVIEFRESDAEKLDLPDSTFNAVLCRWGLMFLPNLPSALARFRKSLIPGGRLSAAVWSAPSKVPLIDVASSTVRKQLNAPAPPAGSLSPFSLADTLALERTFSQAGFKDIKVETVQATFSFDSPETFTRFQQQIGAPLQAMLAGQTEERKKQVWDAVTEAVWPYADSHGRVSFDNEAVCIVGKS